MVRRCVMGSLAKVWMCPWSKDLMWHKVRHSIVQIVEVISD